MAGLAPNLSVCTADSASLVPVAFGTRSAMKRAVPGQAHSLSVPEAASRRPPYGIGHRVPHRSPAACRNGASRCPGVPSLMAPRMRPKLCRGCVAGDAMPPARPARSAPRGRGGPMPPLGVLLAAFESSRLLPIPRRMERDGEPTDVNRRRKVCGRVRSHNARSAAGKWAAWSAGSRTGRRATELSKRPHQCRKNLRGRRLGKKSTSVDLCSRHRSHRRTIACAPAKPTYSWSVPDRPA